MTEIDNGRPKETEISILKVEYRIIALDGVDGSGKSTLAEMLVNELNRRNKKTVKVKFDLKGEGEGEKRIKRILEERKPPEKIVSGLIAAGINRAYGEQIIPALTDGNLVVLDRSEIDLLRFAIEFGDQPLFDKRLEYLQKGLLTQGLWAGNRVFVEMDPEEVWKNLISRENKSKYDPKNLEEVRNRVRAQHLAEDTLSRIPTDGKVNIVRITNKYDKNYQEYLKKLVSEISDKLI